MPDTCLDQDLIEEKARKYDALVEAGKIEAVTEAPAKVLKPLKVPLPAKKA
jgi:hypothetical protein